MSDAKLTFIVNYSSRFLYNIVNYLTDKMNSDRDAPSTDEYLVAAVHIFECCSGESTGTGSGTLRADALIDKFAPLVKTKAEFNYLKSILDPNQSNPEINVTKLADALHTYSESHNTKVDLDESFNLKNAQMPQDSDSGISSDGIQLLEEVQCSLREKAHLAHRLRSQLHFAERQHEEAVAALAAERDSLRAHLNMLREENMTLTQVRRECEEACDRLCESERALGEARRELDSLRRRDRLAQDRLATLETERTSLQELLTKSKGECHRINEMYSARQAALREQCEALGAERAELRARLHDQGELLHQVVTEKVGLEVELKEVLNKSHETRSPDVSYSDEQMLAALDSLDSLRAEPRGQAENELSSEDSFLYSSTEPHPPRAPHPARGANMSLYDEMRLSECDTPPRPRPRPLPRTRPRHDTDCDQRADIAQSCYTSGAGEAREGDRAHVSRASSGAPTDEATTHDESSVYCAASSGARSAGAGAGGGRDSAGVCRARGGEGGGERDAANGYTLAWERDGREPRGAGAEVRTHLDEYEQNLNMLQNFLDEGNENNNYLQTVVQSLQAKLGVLEAACGDQAHRLASLCRDTERDERAERAERVGCRTHCEQVSVSTQAGGCDGCAGCEQRAPLPRPRRLRTYLWEALKCMFQVFAVVCFVCAVSLLYGVPLARRRGGGGCERDGARVPWRWFDAQDILDLLLRIEYVADIPM